MKKHERDTKKTYCSLGLIGALGLTTAILAFKNNGFETKILSF